MVFQDFWVLTLRPLRCNGRHHELEVVVITTEIYVLGALAARTGKACPC